MGELIRPGLVWPWQRAHATVVPRVTPSWRETAEDSDVVSALTGPSQREGMAVWETPLEAALPVPSGSLAPSPSPVSMQLHSRFILEAGIYFYAHETPKSGSCIRGLRKAKHLQAWVASVISWF